MRLIDLQEKIYDKIDLTTGFEMNKVLVHENPSKSELARLLEISPEGLVRGSLLKNADGVDTLYAWSAKFFTHYDMMMRYTWPSPVIELYLKENLVELGSELDARGFFEIEEKIKNSQPIQRLYGDDPLVVEYTGEN